MKGILSDVDLTLLLKKTFCFNPLILRRNFYVILRHINCGHTIVYVILKPVKANNAVIFGLKFIKWGIMTSLITLKTI